ncbi:MAG: PDDEXK nuclease domain-containing protein [Elusimicrobiota bacterium]|jgi:predicted nuclease of restriction endonuclease-like (RecB) superfamily|nr:PDDEXK nuclease domain-containing protein [Elusimicrobiota bacterium]
MLVFKNNEEQNKYYNVLSNIKLRIKKAQYDSLKKINKELIKLYCDIGEIIVNIQKQNNWGNSIVEKLSKDLYKEFQGIKGFSARNLWNMRKFYLAYKNEKILQPLVAEISWSHNLIILDKCKNKKEKFFYINMIRKFSWSKNILIHQIENKTYQRYLENQNNFDKSLPKINRDKAKLIMKDEFIFDFLELKDDYSEYELEQSLLSNIKNFLIEMGGDMCFIGNQYKIEVDGEEFFIDILLYHRELKCLIAVELKIGEFKPEYAGKMQFYLSILDDKVKKSNENASIGIIICKDKNKMIVEYALKNINKPIGVATYSIIKKLPKELERYLPSHKDLEKQIFLKDKNL